MRHLHPKRLRYIAGSDKALTVWYHDFVQINPEGDGKFMTKQEKKMIAPIVIAILFVVYYVGIVAVFCILPGIPLWVKILFSVVPLALAGVMIGVLSSRIKEIRSGEEDDLSQY